MIEQTSDPHFGNSVLPGRGRVWRRSRMSPLWRRRWILPTTNSSGTRCGPARLLFRCSGWRHGKVLLLAETGRKLSREKWGGKFGLSIPGGGTIRNLVLDPLRSKPALILLQQEGQGILAGQGINSGGYLGCTWNGEPCVFATKVASDCVCFGQPGCNVHRSVIAVARGAVNNAAAQT
jgi:hypothetical protein